MRRVTLNCAVGAIAFAGQQHERSGMRLAPDFVGPVEIPALAATPLLGPVERTGPVGRGGAHHFSRAQELGSP